VQCKQFFQLQKKLKKIKMSSGPFWRIERRVRRRLSPIFSSSKAIVETALLLRPRWLQQMQKKPDIFRHGAHKDLRLYGFNSISGVASRRTRGWFCRSICDRNVISDLGHRRQLGGRRVAGQERLEWTGSNQPHGTARHGQARQGTDWAIIIISHCLSTPESPVHGPFGQNGVEHGDMTLKN